MAVKHLFESEIADGPDDTVVRPSDWNADHEIETSAVTPTALDKILLLDESDSDALAHSLVSALVTLIFADPVFTGNPTAPTQSANNNSTRLSTTAYVDLAVAAAIAGLKWKQSVRVASTAAVTLASAFENGDTVDGVTLATGDRILIKDQSSATENGIYVVAASGAPARASDADAGSELVNATVFVEQGTANADKMFVCTNNATPTLGVTSITFTQFSSGGGSVSDTVYGSGWNGDTTNAPSKNAVYDKIETLTNIGKQTIYIPASAMISAGTSGASTATLESASNKLNYAVIDFDSTTQEYAHFQAAMPKSWDEGTVTFKAFWAAGVASTGGVAWGLQGIAASDGDTIDTAFGTAVYVVDNGQSSTAKQYVSGESGAVTIGGSPAEGDLVYFRVTRDPANGSDDMAADARLIGIQLFFTTNAGNDA